MYKETTYFLSTILLNAFVNVFPQVRAMCAASLTCLTIVAVLPDFAVSPASTIALIRVTTVVFFVFALCVLGDQVHKTVRGCSMLLCLPLRCTPLCCPASLAKGGDSTMCAYNTLVP